MDIELIECSVLYIPLPPPVSSILVNIITIHPTAWVGNLEVMLVFLFFLQFKTFPKCSSNAPVCLHFPNSKPLSSLTRTTVALTALFTCVLAAIQQPKEIWFCHSLVEILHGIRIAFSMKSTSLTVAYAVPHDLTPTCLSNLTSWTLSSVLPSIITFWFFKSVIVFSPRAFCACRSFLLEFSSHGLSRDTPYLLHLTLHVSSSLGRMESLHSIFTPTSHWLELCCVVISGRAEDLSISFSSFYRAREREVGLRQGG